MKSFRFSHPGGFEITARAIHLCALLKDSVILDVGSGFGESLKFIEEKYGYRAIGIDNNKETVFSARSYGNNVLYADALNIPFPCEYFDAVLFECSLSKISDEKKVLREVFRVLKPNGRAVVCDFYSNSASVCFNGVLGRVSLKDDMCRNFTETRFNLLGFEDHSRQMTQFYGQMIFDYGAVKASEILGANVFELKQAKCSYGIFVLEKRE